MALPNITLAIVVIVFGSELRKSNRNLFVIENRKSNNYRYRDSWKSDNFRESNQEKKKGRIS